MFALRSTFLVLILSVATLFGWSRGDLPSLADFASDSESVPVPVIPVIRTGSHGDHQGHREYGYDLTSAESDLLDDSEDSETPFSTVQGARSGSAPGCHGAARLIFARAGARSETAGIPPLLGTLCRFRC